MYLPSVVIAEAIRGPVGGTGRSLFTETVTRASADLAITVAAPSSSGRGATVPVTVTVTNRGPNLAPAVVTDFTVLSGYTVVSAPAATRTGPVLQWTDPSLASGSPVVHQFILRLPAAVHGNVVSAALTYSAAGDRNPFDNLAAALTKVR